MSRNRSSRRVSRRQSQVSRGPPPRH